MSYDWLKVAIQTCCYWKVTRSLVSYDLLGAFQFGINLIERSPDHWWVTTNYLEVLSSFSSLLKGHQIIGELRLHLIEQPPLRRLLKGHQIIGELRLLLSYYATSTSNWKVTRSLVSYDFVSILELTIVIKLKGHQIIGELRQPPNN